MLNNVPEIAGRLVSLSVFHDKVLPKRIFFQNQSFSKKMYTLFHRIEAAVCINKFNNLVRFLIEGGFYFTFIISDYSAAWVASATEKITKDNSEKRNIETYCVWVRSMWKRSILFVYNHYTSRPKLNICLRDHFISAALIRGRLQFEAASI